MLIYISESITLNEAELQSLRRSLTEKEHLILKLEADLGTVGRCQASNSDLTTVEVLESVAGSADDEKNNINAIVVAQRDRLRQRVAELEDELGVERLRQQTLQTEIEKVKEDNVKLFGKIKYLQSYDSRGRNASTVTIDTNSDYSEQYERRLDPFATFSRSERQRSYAKLQLHERASLGIGRAIMSSSSARLTFFLYLVFMHLLVFLVLYRSAYGSACEQDFQKDCVEQFAQHMRQHHEH